MTSKDLGLVTAYAYAVSQGYTGTEEEFAELMASYATVAEEAAESAAEAAASATAAGASETNAASSAASAGQSATSAGNSATSASGSAVQAQSSATAAGQSATQAAGSATAAGNSATAAAGSASQAAASETAAGASATAAAGSATSASGSATAAAGSATEADASADRAQEILDSIPEDYSELSEDVANLSSALNKISLQLFANNNYNAATKAMSSLFYALYIPSVTYKGNLRLSVLKRNNGGTWQIRFYANVNNNITLIYNYTTTTNPEANGEQFIVINPALGINEPPLYGIIDWSKVTSGYSSTGNTDSQFILADSVYDGSTIGLFFPFVDKVNNIEPVYDTTFNIFNNNNATTYTKTFSKLFKCLYIPDETYKGNLRWAVLRRNSNSIWSIRFYASINGEMTLIYDYSTTSNPEKKGVQLIEIPAASGVNMPNAYGVVDWSVLTSTYSETGKTSEDMILSDEVYVSRIIPLLIRAVFVAEKINGFVSDDTEKNIVVDSIDTSEMATYTFKGKKTYDVPYDQDGFCLATDIDNHTVLSSATTAQKIEAITPFIYFNGQKVGTVVMFDANNLPYILDLSGTKRYISFT